jgi:hypothetical protein
MGLRQKYRDLVFADRTVSYADLPKSGLKDELSGLILDGWFWWFQSKRPVKPALFRLPFHCQVSPFV